MSRRLRVCGAAFPLHALRIYKLRRRFRRLVVPVTEQAELPEPLKSQVAAMMALRDLEFEKQRADRLLQDANTLYELRGWLRLCEDSPAGHAEFYRWACHYIFGDDAPGDSVVSP